MKQPKIASDDAVNHPKHYNGHPSGIECIDVGNAVKYIWRADLKNDAIEDLEKAAWYIDAEIKLRKEQATNPEVNLHYHGNTTGSVSYEIGSGQSGCAPVSGDPGRTCVEKRCPCPVCSGSGRLFNLEYASGTNCMVCGGSGKMAADEYQQFVKYWSARS